MKQARTSKFQLIAKRPGEPLLLMANGIQRELTGVQYAEPDAEMFNVYKCWTHSYGFFLKVMRGKHDGTVLLRCHHLHKFWKKSKKKVCNRYLYSGFDLNLVLMENRNFAIGIRHLDNVQMRHNT